MKKRKKYKTNTGFKMAHLGLVLLMVTAFMTAMKPAPKIENIIIGSWKYEYHGKDSITLTKVKHLKNNTPGIIFKSDGTLIKRQNIGWCGTPPITYGNFSGEWTKTSDVTLVISHTYWDGTIHKNWMLKNASDKRLLFAESDVKFDKKIRQ
ncbi:hypothetical protein NBRC110019_16100 [Neptunitalea chrysea]|uniref:Lipocalin-like domain-containing protein n=1 Tax=Neptunitalea chrysea TaxID=1647581 RepID=A0A9W6B4U6_9FLAO|nr:hypothetical protein [Neptunitalea chrysea]GLB52570.1 hypothetical protein NBRC110019_16100 [Neptunitalea chrysea]